MTSAKFEASSNKTKGTLVHERGYGLKGEGYKLEFRARAWFRAQVLGSGPGARFRAQVLGSGHKCSV